MKLFALILALVIGYSSPALAGPRYSAAKKEAQQLQRAERKLAKRINRLSETDKKRLKSAFKSTDSDGDGVSDIIEGAIGSNRCDADSDDDGFSDSDDYNEDTPGADDDSPGSDDNNPGTSEFEAKGIIASFDDPSLVIGSTTYTITMATEFIGAGFTKDDLRAGMCVEVKGLRSGADRDVTRIKRDDDC
jgi:hypothetical protein